MGISDIFFESIMRAVCNDVARWREEGDWDVPVSVNLSAHQLRNSDLVSLIKGVLSSTQVDRKLINLELTETVLLEDLTVAQPMLDDLASYGVGIHIDDFGTGYSSLSYLAQLPVQTIKIDRTFVKQLSTPGANTRVIEAIIALGKARSCAGLVATWCKDILLPSRCPRTSCVSGVTATKIPKASSTVLPWSGSTKLATS
jgi:EAL domain-containing protein (putative c-di-GMP-specific phosphodiesterase class I)